MHRRDFLGSIGIAALVGAGARSADDTDSRARALHRDSTVIVIHDHRPIAPDVPLMRAGGVTAKVFQLGVDVEIGADFQKSASERAGWFKKTRAALDQAKKIIEGDPKHLLLARSAADIESAKKEGKIAVMLGVEGGKLLEGDLANLRDFHRLGLRELQLRWAVPNQLVEQEALTEFGAAVVRECQKLGIVVDLTHIPAKAFDQVVELASKPLIVSHGTGAELGLKRIGAIAKTKGVIGVHFYSSYLGEKPTVKQVVDAVDYLVQKAGPEIVALGVDFFPKDGEWAKFQRAQGTKDISWAIPDLSHMEQVTRGLVGRGFSDQQIRGFLGANFLRVCRTIFGK